MAPSVPTSIATVLDAALRREPDHEAVVARSGRLSYAQLDQRANQSARALIELGVRPGDRVAVSLPNDLDIVTAFHGAMRLGALWVGVNRDLAPPEVDYILGDTSTSPAIVDGAPADVPRAPVPPPARSSTATPPTRREATFLAASGPRSSIARTPASSRAPSTLSPRRPSRTRAAPRGDRRVSCTVSTTCSSPARPPSRAGITAR